MKISILDPSLRNHHGEFSINLGDVIIYQAVVRFLHSVFGQAEINRISTHQYLEERHYRLIEESDLVFIGGTNILSSDIETYNQWKLTKEFKHPPRVKNAVLFGVGWWQYQGAPTSNTTQFYEHILSKKWIHSVRDSYTQMKLAEMGMKNTLNTCCPTAWGLHNVDTNRKNIRGTDCVFTLTDYSRNPTADSSLIEIILRNYSGNVYFFPQGSEDVNYLYSLEIYISNRGRITILDHCIEALDSCISNRSINYVGTRLHTGTRCLQQGVESLIVAVDNRAAEIGNDINLPVVQRNEFFRVEEWISGKPLFSPIILPMENIEKWRRQFTR